MFSPLAATLYSPFLMYHDVNQDARAEVGAGC